MKTIENILKLIGIYKCHYCKKHIMLWQKHVGYFESMDLNTLLDGKVHAVYATWFTHKGECTEKDIENENNRI